MAQTQDKSKKADYQQVYLDDPDFLHGIVANVLQQLIDSEATDHLGAERDGSGRDRRPKSPSPAVEH